MKRIESTSLFCLCFSMLLVLLPFPASAQIFDDFEANVNLPKNGDDANRMEKSVLDLGIPPTDLAVYEELKDARQRAEAYISYKNNIPDRVQRLNELQNKLSTATVPIQALLKSCKSKDAAGDLQSQLQNLTFQMRALGGEGSKAYSDISDFARGNAEEACKKLASDPKILSKFVDDANQAVKDALKKVNDEAGYADRLAKAWQARVEMLQKAQGSLRTQQDQTSQLLRFLPWIVAILCAFSLAILFGIRFFEPDVQMELIASGQVIQFPTVMVLLVVIIALGLTKILLENTLAALLGGLAGYVLSQGVGRAAAREAERRRISAELPATSSSPVGAD